MTMLGGLSPLAAQSPPDSFFVVHCEDQNGNSNSWVNLGVLLDEADNYGVKLSVELSPSWAQMIVSDPTKRLELDAWRNSGHAFGAHHHGTTHPAYDGYTDRDPASLPNQMKYFGNMQNYKDLLENALGEELQFGGIDDAVDEWPHAVPLRTYGGKQRPNLVQTPNFNVVNRYGVWQLSHMYLDAPIDVPDMKLDYAAATAGEVVGVVTHVWDYIKTPGMVVQWFSFLQTQDPTGVHQKTVPALVGTKPLALQCSPNSFSWTTPAPLNFSLDTEAWYPLHTYRILFSNSGVAPGFDIGDAYIAGSHIGLNLDQVLLRSYYSPNTNVYQNNYAALDSAGLATSQLSLPANIPATFIGSPICAQALVFNMAGELLYTSNSIEIMINL